MTASTAGITARAVLRQLDAHRLGAQMSALAAMTTPEQAEVRRQLAAVRPGARVDLPVLLDSVRRAVAERAAAERPDPTLAFKYALTCMSDAELADLEADLARRVDDGDGDQPFEPHWPSWPDSPGSAGASPIPRRRLGRAREPAGRESAPSATTLAGTPENPPSAAPRPFRRPVEQPSFVGFGAAGRDRPYGCPEDADYDAWARPKLPSWLIDEHEAEREHEDA